MKNAKLFVDSLKQAGVNTIITYQLASYSRWSAPPPAILYVYWMQYRGYTSPNKWGDVDRTPVGIGAVAKFTEEKTLIASYRNIPWNLDGLIEKLKGDTAHRVRGPSHDAFFVVDIQYNRESFHYVMGSYESVYYPDAQTSLFIHRFRSYLFGIEEGDWWR